MHKSFRYLPAAATTPTKPGTTGVDLVLKIATALLMAFAATLVLVHADVYCGQALIVF